MNFIAEVDELFYETFIPKATKSRVQKYEYEHVIGVEDGDEHMVRANVGTVVVVGVLSVTVSHTYSPAWTELHLWSMCAQKHASKLNHHFVQSKEIAMPVLAVIGSAAISGIGRYSLTMKDCPWVTSRIL